MAKMGTQIAGASRLLNGVNNLEIDLGNVRNISLQAALVSSQTNYLWYRVEYTAALGATTIATADGFLSHGGSVDIMSLDPQKHAYLYLLVTDNAGAAANGGLLDYAMILRDNQ